MTHDMFIAAPSRRTARGVLAFVVLAFALGTCAHYACGCYSARDRLPPCSAAPTACGGYPAAARDGGAR